MISCSYVVWFRVQLGSLWFRLVNNLLYKQGLQEPYSWLQVRLISQALSFGPQRQLGFVWDISPSCPRYLPSNFLLFPYIILVSVSSSCFTLTVPMREYTVWDTHPIHEIPVPNVLRGHSLDYRLGGLIYGRGTLIPRGAPQVDPQRQLGLDWDFSPQYLRSFLPVFLLFYNYYACLLLPLASPLLFPCARYTVWVTHLVHGIPIPYNSYQMFPCNSVALLWIHRAPELLLLLTYSSGGVLFCTFISARLSQELALGK